MDFKERKEFTFVSKALPEDAFSVVSFRGTEAISRLFEFDITLASQDPEIDLKAVLQNPATLTIVHGIEELPIHGVLARFEQLHEVKQHAFYRAVLVPKLWIAGLYRENQIFLDKTVPQVIEEVLKQAGMSGQDYEMNLTRKDHPAWEYICQYQETDLDFISRWMEREGIYYFFEQTEQGAKMILSDNLSIHKDIKGDTDIPYSPPSGLVSSGKEIVAEFACSQTRPPAKVILKDHNYRNPSLEVKAETEVDANGQGKVYVYGEHFKSPGDGDVLAKIRAEELLCREKVFHCEATAPAFSPGFTFDLSRHYRSEYNRKYLITEISHEGSRAEDMLSGLGQKPGGQEEETGYRNRFVCIPADVQFRPVRTTPKPKFYGTMNAFVDGKEDSSYAEMDEYGRYKVVLPLDLSGRKEGKASRFIRMAQPYSGFPATAGKNLPSGMHFPLPKGAEVLLTFVDGDPDRPVISSAVPNPETGSPVTNSNQNQSVIRDNFGNELILDSTPGNEYVRLYSPNNNSGVEIGVCKSMWTKSDTQQFALGNSWECVLGNKLEAKCGTATDIKIGFVHDITLGHVQDFILGSRQTFNYALDLQSNNEPIVKLSEKDVLTAAALDQVISAGDQVCIIGGESNRIEEYLIKARKGKTTKKDRREFNEIAEKDEAKDKSRSIINVFPEKLILSVSDKGDTYAISNSTRIPDESEKRNEEIFMKSPPKRKMAIASIVSGAAAIASNVGTEIAHYSIKDPIAFPAAKGAIGAFTAITAFIYVWLYRKWAKKYTQDDAIEPVGQINPAAKIELNHEGKVLINSKEKSVVIRVGANNDKNLQGAGLRLDKDAVLLGNKEHLNDPSSIKGSQLYIKNDILLRAEKDIGIVASTGEVKIKSNSFHANGNLRVLSN